MSHSGMSQLTTVSKRHRQAVSCNACRRRKSKCDRQHPCSSCTMRREDSACQYDLQRRSSAVGYHRELQHKLAHLEQIVQSLAEKHSANSDKENSLADSNENESALASSNLSRAQENVYHGKMSWIALVEETQGIHDMMAIRTEGDTIPSDIILGSGASITIDNIVDSLPTRQDSDRLVSAYFNSKFLAVPFIHVHHFKRRYDTFWGDPSSASFHWISILFSILSTGAMVLRLKGSDDSLAQFPVAYSRELLDKAAQCLVAGQYLRAKPFSVEALLMQTHARNVQNQDFDPTLWALYVLNVRLAQRQGFHLDPSKSPLPYTPFEAEMRRRVWFMIQAGELLHSFHNGMHSVVNQDCCDVHHPTNLTDDDFDEDTVTLPAPRGVNDPNPILVYIFKSRLCRIMRRILHDCVSTNETTYIEVLARNHELEEWYASLPPCLRIRPIQKTAFTDPNYTIMHRIMLELLYLRSLCILHRPYLTANTNDAMHGVSRKICRESATNIIELQIELDGAINPGGRMYEDRYIISNLTLHHFLLAASTLCLDISYSKDISAEERTKNVDLLQTAHRIWLSRSPFSSDAMQASKILHLIVTKVEAVTQTPADDPPIPTQISSHILEPLPFAINTVSSFSSHNDSDTGYSTGSCDAYSSDSVFSNAGLLDWYSI